MNEQTTRQLAVLREVDVLLSRLHIRFWLRGGWAVDFLLGEVTRPHADLDLVTWQRHRQRIQRALLEADFQVVRELIVQTDYRKDDQEITFVFLERTPDGSVIAHGASEWTWPPDALPLRRHYLRGISARVVAPQQMLRDLDGWQDATGRAPRPKDFNTMSILRSLIPRA